MKDVEVMRDGGGGEETMRVKDTLLLTDKLVRSLSTRLQTSNSGEPAG